MIRFTLTLISMISAIARADCVLGSYKAVGNGLKRCERTMNKADYTAQPLGIDLTNYLDKSASAAEKTDFQTVAGVPLNEGLGLIRGEMKSGHYETALTADSAAAVPALGRVAGGMNRHLKLDGDVARLAEAEQADSTRIPLKDSIADLDALGAKNQRGLSQASRDCANNSAASAELRAVEIKFKDNNESQYIIPTGISYQDGRTNVGSLNFVDDIGQQARQISVRNGKTYFQGANKVEYEVTLYNVAAKKMGQVRSFNDRRSTACYVYAKSRSNAPTKSSSLESGTGSAK